jgi:HK97 family phage prohead protease
MNKSDKLDIPYQVKSNLSSYKEIDESGRIIKAVANTFNYFDSDYDVLVPGCCKRSIQNRGANTNAADKILHAFNHDLTQLPGKSIVEHEDIVNGNTVLYVESKLSESTDGENLLIKYKEGIYNQHSIGFQYMDLQYIEAEAEGWDDFLKNMINPDEAIKVGYGWKVNEINLYEWSTVAFGANKLTPYLGVKSDNKKVQLNNLYVKLEALIKSAKSGVKNKDIFELQYKQLKQMISENMNSFEKPTPKDAGGSDTSSKWKSWNI